LEQDFPVRRFESQQPDELILEAKNGVDEAYIKLHELYLPLIESMTGKYMTLGGLSKEEGDDMRQETELAFYRALMSYNTYQDKVSFGLYAKICIGNRLVSYLRKFHTEKGNSLSQGYISESEIHELSFDEFDENNIAVYSDEGRSPLDYVIRDETSADIRRIISDELTVYEKKVFNLYVQGRSAKEIALSVGRSEKSVSNAIYRIRAKIRNLLLMEHL